jgi:hypothetical protein
MQESGPGSDPGMARLVSGGAPPVRNQALTTAAGARPCWRAMSAARPFLYQRPWTVVPLCSVTTFLALPVQSMKAGRSSQPSRASRQCSTTPAGDS